MTPCIVYIKSISTDGLYFLPLSKEGVIGRIVFTIQSSTKEVFAAANTDKKFHASVEYKDDSDITFKLNMEVKIIEDLKGNLAITTDSTAFHTEIKIENVV